MHAMSVASKSFCPQARPSANTGLHLEFRVKRDGTISCLQFPYTRPPKFRKGQDKDSKRKRRGIKLTAVQDQSKATESKASRVMRIQKWAFVFVGNLSPSITEDELARVFAHCGKIVQIAIRVSSGRVTVAPPGTYQSSSKDRLYASIHFTERMAAIKARRLDGSMLHERRIVVCYSAADLPDTKELINEYLAKRERRSHSLFSLKFLGNMYSTINDAVRRVTVDRTLIPGDNE
ncbi:hypothetical protein B0H21DRAFT_78445 [Amylocystis lapponica]|nr:hypothetical protein B0H21DRAFT_78445 [Amylocystis lapponica]